MSPARERRGGGTTSPMVTDFYQAPGSTDLCFYLQTIHGMSNPTKTFPSNLRSGLRWLGSQGSSFLRILSIILATAFLLVPTLSLAQNAINQGGHIMKCVDVATKVPSRAKWDDQPENSFLVSKGSLDIKLTWTLAEASDPKAGAAPVVMSQMCAEWSDPIRINEKDGRPHAGRLDLEQVNQTEQSTQFRINLDGTFPTGIRRPIEIKIISSNPEVIPSLSRTIYVSTRWLCLLISSVFIGVIYYVLANAVHMFYSHSEDGSPGRGKNHGWRVYDPAVISASDYGSASLANLQILWFTFIVIWLLAYGWLVMGRLLNPSTELLWLLGISGTANVLAKSLISGKQRLSLDNWHWLIEREFLKREVDIDPIDVAKWRDFVLDGGVLDPSRYQLIVFGFLIGFNLLLGDVMNVETFRIPEFFLLLQGLSSGVYLFGKSVSPTTKDELEQHISKLKTRSALLPEDKSYLKDTIVSLFGPKAVGPKL